MQWSLSTQGGLPASSTIDNHSLYVSSSNGTLNKIDAQTGSLLWSIPLSNYTGNPHSLSLKSTAIAPQSIVVGDQNSGTLLALNKTSGTLLWKTTIEPNLNAKITSPPTIYEDRVYVGVYSGKSQSNIAALDLKTGQPLWQSNSVPNGAVINGPLTINPSKKRLYALTSNSGQASPLHNHTDTLLVLDMKNGALLLKQSLKESTDPNTDNANKNGAILFTLNINGTTLRRRGYPRRHKATIKCWTQTTALSYGQLTSPQGAQTALLQAPSILTNHKSTSYPTPTTHRYTMAIT